MIHSTHFITSLTQLVQQPRQIDEFNYLITLMDC